MLRSEFIEVMGDLINKYRKDYRIELCSPILAQAILESNWGKSSLSEKYHNYFGMKCGSSWKGKSVNMKTNEEYTPGTLTTINDNFRAYDSIEEGVKGYFEFINTKRYSNLKGIKDPKEYVETIKNDGWATSSTYVNNLMNIINTYGLTKYDENVVVLEKEYYNKLNQYKGTSIVEALNSIGVDSSYNFRSKLAKANGINNYSGTASQNTNLLTKLKAGTLRKV